MGVKVLMVAELEITGEDPDQQVCEALDSFRESVLPSANYGIVLSTAHSVDLCEFSAHSLGEPRIQVRFAGDGPYFVYGS